MITIGNIYLWGVIFELRNTISDHISFDLVWSWYLDRLTIDDGLHDMHFLASIRYVF